MLRGRLGAQPRIGRDQLHDLRVRGRVRGERVERVAEPSQIARRIAGPYRDCRREVDSCQYSSSGSSGTSGAGAGASGIDGVSQRGGGGGRDGRAGGLNAPDSDPESAKPMAGP